ncbi:MAG: hypothetical protein AB3N09_08415 [Tateyamaria sp.]
MAKDYTRNFKNVDIGVSNLELVKPPQLNFKVEIELDKKIAKEAAKDPLLIQEFDDKVQEILAQAKKTVTDKCKVFDKLFLSMVEKGADDKMMKKQLKGLNDAIKNDMKIAEKAAELGIQQVWKDLQSKRKEWRNFKIKVGCSIAGTVAGILVSVAALLTSPWSGGAGGVLAVLGFIKAGIKLAQDIKKLAIDIDLAAKELKGHLAVIEAAAENKGLFALNEVAGAVLNEFVGIAQPTLKSAQECMDTLKAKFAQMIVKMHDLAKTLTKALNTQDKARKEFLTEAAKRLKKHPVKDKAGQLKLIERNFDKEMQSNYNKVQNAVTGIQSMYADSKSWAPKVKDLDSRVKKVELKDSKGLKVFRELVKVAGVATSVIDGNSVASKSGDLALGLGGAAGGYVYDKVVSKAIDGTVFDAA